MERKYYEMNGVDVMGGREGSKERMNGGLKVSALTAAFVISS